MRIYRWHASCYAHARAHSLLVLVSHAEPPDIYRAIWCNTRIAPHRRYYTVECIPSLELLGADYWEGSTIQGHALAAAIMLAQLKQSGLALRGCRY